MAQRFGGKYSPEGGDQERPFTPDPKGGSGSAYAGARVEPAGFRVNLLFVPGVLLGFLSLNDGAVGMATGLAAAGVLTLAAWLTREGVRAEAAYHARKVARRPALPRKMAGSALTGLGVAMAAYLNGGADGTGGALIAAGLFGAVATGLHGVAFGLDPLRDKGMEGVDLHQRDRVARAVDKAEAHLTAMTDAVKRAGDRQVENRVAQFQTKARALLRAVEDDPRDLTAARKFMGVYLKGARDASVKFADVYARNQDAAARADYMALLTDLELSFDAKTQALLLDDNADLTIEIDVLRDRLAREGLRPET